MLNINVSGWDGGLNLQKGERMKKDTEMIMHRFDSNIIIYPIADVHYGALEHNEAAWRSICKEILDTPNAYVILNGDLINNATKSSVSNIYEEAIRPREQKREMIRMLEPLRDRILCITSGNHERRSVKDVDDDPTYDIACKLDLEDFYRPNIAFLGIGLGKRGKAESDKICQQYRIAVTHGAGGGIYTGAAVNRNERFGNIIENIDCLIVGHTHKGTVTRPSKLVVDGKKGIVYQRDYLVISAVSWMEYGGYAMQKMLLPSSYGKPQKLFLNYDKGHKRPTRVEVLW